MLVGGCSKQEAVTWRGTGADREDANPRTGSTTAPSSIKVKTRARVARGIFTNNIYTDDTIYHFYYTDRTIDSIKHFRNAKNRMKNLHDL